MKTIVLIKDNQEQLFSLKLIIINNEQYMSNKEKYLYILFNKISPEENTTPQI